MPDVLLVSVEDWASVSYAYARALRAVDVDALAITAKLHGFDYTKQAKQVPVESWRNYFADSQIIVNMHSREHTGKLPGKHLAVFHGGAKYRETPKLYNDIFNRYVDVSLIQTGDLLGLGAKNEVWTLPPIDLETIKPRLGIHGDKLKIAHYPRHAEDKGGPAVNRVVELLQASSKLNSLFDYSFTSEHVSWPESIARMADCDIYIEAMAPTHLGKPHGAWGITALEAAALGKIVVTNFAHAELYRKTYGFCALQVANSETELELVLRRLLAMSTRELENLQVDSREWVERAHSYEAIGRRLKEVFETYCGDALPVLFDPVAYWERTGGIKGNADSTNGVESGIIFSWLVQKNLLKGSILEVGPGQGNTFNSLRRFADLTDYRMVDFVQSSRELCRQTTSVLPDAWDGKALPYASNSFDAVISADVMLHVPVQDIDTFVAEHARVSKKWLIVSSYVGLYDGKSRAPLAPHCFRHAYEILWKRYGLSVIEKHLTHDRSRCLWLLAKERQ